MKHYNNNILTTCYYFSKKYSIVLKVFSKLNEEEIQISRTKKKTVPALSQCLKVPDTQ